MSLDILTQPLLGSYIRFGTGNDNTVFTTEWARISTSGLTLKSLSGTTDRVVQVNSGGTLAAQTQLLTGKLSDSIAISLLIDESNWGIDGLWIGIDITGTYEGQYYKTNDYYFVAYSDNEWIRLIRG